MIEKEDDYVLSCDICGAEADETFETFADAVDYKRQADNSWISKKIDGTWHDICSECAESYKPNGVNSGPVSY